MQKFWDVLRHCAPSGSVYGDIYVQDSNAFSLSFKDGRVENISRSESGAASLRYLVGRSGRSWMAGCDGLSPELLASTARRQNPRPKPFKIPPAFSPGNRQSFIHPAKINAREISLEIKVKVLEAMDKRIRELVRGKAGQISLRLSHSFKRVRQVVSDGLVSEEIWHFANLSAHVLLKDGGKQASAYESMAGIGGWERIDAYKPLELAETVSRRALAKLEAPKAPSGTFPVVIAYCAGGTFVHEAIGHSLEADAIQDGVSPSYRRLMGKTVAEPSVSIVDDPALPGHYGSYRFDDEGVPAKSARLVDKGVLSTYLYDRVTARREKKESNGHGRRDSAFFRPIPRMSNIFIEPGTEDPASILRSVKNGMYVTRMGGGEVNTATGEFMFEVEEGFWIENGEVRHMVRDANLIGVASEALASIKRVGTDLGWSVGVCGKDGQSVPVSDGLPTILIEKLLVGGSAG